MVIMLAKKGAALILFVLALATLVLASPIQINAAKTRNVFYLKVYATIVNLEWQHFADNRRVIWHIVEEGIVNDNTNTTVGTIAADVVQIIDMKTGRATVSTKYEIDFYSGAIIEGTMTGKLQYYIGTTNPPDLDGKFVGHGDMHVMGDVYLIMEGTTPISILDGYSW